MLSDVEAFLEKACGESERVRELVDNDEDGAIFELVQLAYDAGYREGMDYEAGLPNPIALDGF